jgi:polyhydroxybutyrate depolymerase
MRLRFSLVPHVAVFLFCLHCSGSNAANPPGNHSGGFVGLGGAGPQAGAPPLGAGGTTSPSSGGVVGSGGTVSTGAGGVVLTGSGGTPNGGVANAGGGSGSAMSGGGSSGGSAGAAGSPGNCGMRSGMRGKTTRSLTVGSAKRSYVAYLPQSASPTTPVPFVYVFHGATQTGANMYEITEYSKLADSENIAVVFPDGQATSSATSTGALNPWSVTDGPTLCGAGALVSNPNAVDFAFLDAIKADMIQDQCLDAAHVYATGFSMGGYFSEHIACDRTDFRAAGPHSGATMADLTTCKTARVPIIIFHGTGDILIAPGCDDPNSPAQSGFPPSATLWAKKNGCQATYKTIPEDGDGTNKGQCYLYDGCPPDGQVELCTFTNLPHAWAGAPTCPGCIGSGAGFASATQLEWAFFKKYAW